MGRPTQVQRNRSHAERLSRVARLAWYSGALLVVAACQGLSGDDDAAFSHDLATLPGGTAVVRNQGPRALSGTPGWSAQEELRIGSRSGGGPQQFGSVSAIEVDAEGRIYVGDGLAREVRVFEPSGAFSHRFGGEGAGPGEFQRVGGLSFGPKGKLWVQDTKLQRYSVFESDGTLLATHPMRIAETAASPWGNHVDGRGRLTVFGYQLPWPASDQRFEPSSGFPNQVLFHPIQISFDAAEMDSFPPISYRLNTVEGLPRIPKPNSGTLIWHLDDEGRIWFGNSRSYRLYRRDLKGDTTLIFTMPFEPDRASDAEKAEVARTWLRTGSIPVDQVLEERPVLQAITTDDQGRVYVFPHLDGMPGGTIMDVFDSSGVFVARVPLPTMLTTGGADPAPIIRGGYIYGVTKDEVDVPYVVRLRLRRP